MKNVFKILGVLLVIISLGLAVGLFMIDLETSLKVFYGLLIIIVFLIGTGLYNRGKVSGVDEVLEEVEVIPMPSTIVVKKGEDDKYHIVSSLKGDESTPEDFLGTDEERRQALTFYDEHKKILGQFHLMAIEPFTAENFDHYDRCNSLNFALESMEQLKRYCHSQGDAGKIYFKNIYEYKPEDSDEYISFKQKLAEDWTEEKTYLDTFDHIAKIIDENSPLSQEEFVKKLGKVNQEYAQFIVDDMIALGTIHEEEKDDDVFYVFNREWMSS